MPNIQNEEVIALNALADVKLVTSIREGINLGAMEFIACQQQTRHGCVAAWWLDAVCVWGELVAFVFTIRSTPPTVPQNPTILSHTPRKKTNTQTHPNPHSVLVYSEFAGCSTDFKGALIINPYDSDKVAESIHVALTMSSTTKQVRIYGCVCIMREGGQE